MPNRLAILAAIVLYLCGGVTMAQTNGGRIKVKATGQSPAQLPNAREAAIEDALRRCVEAAGVHVASESLTGNFTLIKDAIYTKTAGLVERYEVLQENRDQDGLYTVRVEAVVSRDTDISVKIEAWKSLIRRVGRPYVMVVGSADRRPFEERLTAELQGTLEERGLHVRDLAVLSENQRREAERAARGELDPEMAALIADEIGADYLVIVSVEGTKHPPQETYGITIHRADATGILKVITSDTATVLASKVVNESVTSQTRAEAVRKVTSRSLAAALDQAIKRISVHWLEEVDQRGGREVTIILQRFGSDRISSLVQKLRDVEGLKDIIIDSTDTQGRSHIRVVTWSSASDVGFALQKLEPGVEVTRSTKYRLFVTRRGGSGSLVSSSSLPWAIAAVVAAVVLIAVVLKLASRKSTNP